MKRLKCWFVSTLVVAFLCFGNVANAAAVDLLNLSAYSEGAPLPYGKNVIVAQDEETGEKWIIHKPGKQTASLTFFINLSGDIEIFISSWAGGQFSLSLIANDQVITLEKDFYTKTISMLGTPIGTFPAPRWGLKTKGQYSGQIESKSDSVKLSISGYTAKLYDDGDEDKELLTKVTLEKPNLVYTQLEVISDESRMSLYGLTMKGDSASINIPPDEYSLTLDTSGTGDGTVSGGGKFTPNTSVTPKATADEGSVFVGWTPASCGSTFELNSDTTCTAEFALNNYILTVNTTGKGSGTADGGGTFAHGTNVTPTAKADKGSVFAGWTPKSCNSKFELTADTTCTVKFSLNYYTLTVNTTGIGSGTVDGGGTFAHGTSVTPTVTANEGSVFVGWTPASCGSTFELTSDTTCTAEFTLNDYTLTMNTTGTGSGTVDGGGSFAHGTSVTPTATANEGSVLVGWTPASCGSAFKLTSDITCTAEFKPIEYTLTLDISGTGNGQIDSNSFGTLTHNTSITLTATANEGNVFVGWTPASCGSTFELTSDITCTAEFQMIPTLSVSSADTPPNNESIVLDCNENATLHLSNTEGSWEAFKNGVSMGLLKETKSSYSDSTCEDIWIIQLKHPDNHSISSNQVKLSWSRFKLTPNTYSPLQPHQKLLTTYWAQYDVLFDYDNDGDMENFIPGCTAVAVGQLINYYFQQGYRKDWLEVMLEHTTVYPRVEADTKDEKGEPVYEKIIFNVSEDIQPWQNKCTGRYNCYIDFPKKLTNLTGYDETRLGDFLTYVAIGLDAEFRQDSTGTKLYIGEEPYPFLNPQPGEDIGLVSEKKLGNLLLDRFRFKSEMMEILGPLSRLDYGQDYIIDSLNRGHPILISLYGFFNSDGKYSGHSAIIDSYQIDNGDFQVRFNMGWGLDDDGSVHAADVKWYDGSAAVEVPTRYGKEIRVTYDRFFILTNTVPITWGNSGIPATPTF
ncbi:MAG: hypothetical protein VSS75_032275 [Candidatus Parabeggiatoa sp.]|nr:hypothetical protein [Candidatus Parabeggiatoa sp.]